MRKMRDRSPNHRRTERTRLLHMRELDRQPREKRLFSVRGSFATVAARLRSLTGAGWRRSLASATRTSSSNSTRRSATEGQRREKTASAAAITYSTYSQYALSPPAFEQRPPRERAPTGPLNSRSERVCLGSLSITPASSKYSSAARGSPQCSNGREKRRRHRRDGRRSSHTSTSANRRRPSTRARRVEPSMCARRELPLPSLWLRQVCADAGRGGTTGSGPAPLVAV